MVIMVVFLVMFMMNPVRLEPMTMVPNRWGALATSGGVFLALVVTITLVPWPQEPGIRPADPTRQFGLAIMGDKMLVIMIVGVALFTTMIAATVLATARGRYGKHDIPMAGPSGGHEHHEHHGHGGGQ